MRKLRFWAINLGYLLMSVTVAVTAAQPGNCSALVAQALRAVDSNCTDLGRNNVCYGYNRVDATFIDTVGDDFFSAPADRADLTTLASIQTAPLDVENDQWGVAMMNVQANVPGSLPGQAVTFLLFGDARVENAVTPEEAFLAGDPVRVVVVTGQRINVRSGPGTNFNVIANADPGQLFDVDAQDTTGDWYRISGPAPYQWISRSLFAVQTGSNAALNELPVAPEAPVSPMQAFYFRTGIGAPTCAEAPNLLVVQGPKDVRVSLTVNGAEVALGSTIAFQSGETTLGALKSDARIGDLVQGFDAPDDSACLFTEMSVLEGDALANGGELFVPLGHWSKSATCLDQNRAPTFTTPFGGLREMTEEELAEFAPLEDVPFPHYPLDMPTREQMQESVERGPDEKPEPTRLPVIQIARPTLQATRSDGNTTPPLVTEVPGVTPVPVDNQPSCDGFRPTSPTGAANMGSQLFTWDPARNVAGYQLEISASDGTNTVPGSTKLYRVGGENTSMTVDLYGDFVHHETNAILWKLQVLVQDGQGNLTTLCESAYQYTRLVYPG